MRQVVPVEQPVEQLDVLLAGDERPAPAGRPWVMANMVVSVDGAVAVDGRSGALGGEPDRAMFTAVRSLPDVILVGAGTARTERYRRPAPGPSAALRTGRGQSPAPRLAVVSRRAELPADQPFLDGDGPDPLLYHPSAADLSGLPPGVEPRRAGTEEVDLAAVLGNLADDGARTVLCEGGPSLLGALHAADLVDELFVTLSPHLVGGPGGRMLSGSPEQVRELVLHRLLVADDVLLATYRRSRTG